ncbi:conserved hypothetical protein [Shewanella halifaxensis HAW-EB4]|uniref:Polysaccharide pyruvyl transferase domain-containing protein n=1 Tax=Shewanella halifaxensis (strain HAW-EB4) TaxID=458817 RepID=B0TMJ0_SHEHH|nr:polysaccharide pyruvyl transferase family protein [Shewanella halifaxensis]ABZ76059.1 conserved hypothetical protein [Shewanella halifaxensis HAW-EB4]
MKKNNVNKVGLLNFHYSDNNYGAVLQAAALFRVVKNLGYDVEQIDFIPHTYNETFLSSSKRKIKYLIESLFKNKLSIDDKCFEQFRHEFLKRSVKIFSKEELEGIGHEYDAIIVGSDQVWRADYTGRAKYVYFLDFVPKSCKKVSYAASFGLDDWMLKNDSSATSNISGLLSKFDHVSVRESTGVKVCKDIFNVDAEHVLDPTLLVSKDFFNEIIDGNSNDVAEDLNSLVYYKLDKSPVFEEQLKLISKEKFNKVENLFYDGGVQLKYNEVGVWLSKIKNSKLVITDSFHCVCFSIIFEKNFICSANSSRGLTRLESLLGALGLQDRICIDDSQLSNEKYLLEIDYEAVKNKVSLLRIGSLEFMKNALK